MNELFGPAVEVLVRLLVWVSVAFGNQAGHGAKHRYNKDRDQSERSEGDFDIPNHFRLSRVVRIFRMQ